MCPTIGDPILRRFPLRLVIDCLNLGGPIGKGAGECADCGRFSPGGENPKHSSADINVGAGTEVPLPNLKGGPSTRAALQGNNVVVKPLVRDNEGLIREGLRRLNET